ncbi:hypothetical protein ACLMJK_002555 [Lecanora helva]
MYLPIPQQLYFLAGLMVLQQTSVTWCTPLRPNDTVNLNFSLDGPRKPQWLGFTPWPATPYNVPLAHGYADLYILRVDRAITTPPIGLAKLQEFIADFASNIEQEYPSPSFVAPLARQSTVDVVSYTRWIIQLKEVFLGDRLPTDLAVAALSGIGSLLGRHGASSINFLIKDGNTVYANGILILQGLSVYNSTALMSTTSRAQDDTLNI